MYIVAHAGLWLTIINGILIPNWVVQRLADYFWVPPHFTLGNAQYQNKYLYDGCLIKFD